ncbi:MAG: hypothetical protein N2594_06165 [Clostridiales bacterium]|nr:hypothetical protein [Clostridiales bacterium]
MFNIGSKIYHYKYGGGIITNIEDREVMNEIKRYYTINFLIDNVELMMPIDEKTHSKLRSISSLNDIESIKEILKEKPKKLPLKWIDRLKFYTEAMTKGDIFIIAEVIRDINANRKNKVLSKSEEKILEDFILLLSSEISLILDVSINETRDKIINNLLS